MNINKIILVLSIVLAVAGVGLTFYLTQAHFSGNIESICTEGGGCGEVLRSSYSQFWGVPTALYGLLYFVSLLILLSILPYFKDDILQRFLTTILSLNSAALVVSILLTAYSLLSLNTLCVYCISSSGLVFILFTLSLFMTIRDFRVKETPDILTPSLKISLSVVTVLLLISGGLYYQSVSASNGAQNQTGELTALASEPISLGNPNAPIRVIEFFDLSCPHCQRFTLNTFPKIRKNYIETGKVLWTFRDFPIPNSHPHAPYAHGILSLIPSHQYISAKKRIMRDAKRWNARQNENPEEYFDFFLQRYNLSGLSPSQNLLSSIMKRRRVYGELGIRSTPSFMVNGKIYKGGLPYRRWESIFNSLLQQSTGPSQRN